MSKRLRKLPRRDWAVATGIVALLTLLRTGRCLWVHESLWIVLALTPAFVLQGFSYLLLRSSQRSRRQVEMLKEENAKMLQRIEALRAERQMQT